MLWGGRPGVDRQFGSVRDRHLAARDRQRASINRIVRAMTKAGRQVVEGIDRALEQSGLADLARDMGERGLLQTPPMRVTSMKLDPAAAASLFLGRQSGPPLADPKPPPKLYHFEEGSLTAGDLFADGWRPRALTDDAVIHEWPETEADAFAYVMGFDPANGDDIHPSDIKHTHTVRPDGDVTFEVDPAKFGAYLHAMTWPFAVNMGWVAPLGPGGCPHPASAHALLAGCPGWRWCADCGTTLSPEHAEHAATQQVTVRNPDDRTYR